jgi:hypothetical protein
VIPEPFHRSFSTEEKESKTNSNPISSSTSATMITEKKFRPNFVVSCPSRPPHDEDSWESLSIELQHNATMSQKKQEISFLLTGPCARCSIVNINPENGERNREVLQTLANYRRDERSQILFGQYLSFDTEWQERLLNHSPLPSLPLDDWNAIHMIRLESRCVIQRRNDRQEL